MARRCAVCGLDTDEPVCPRCNTILLRDRAICPKCGKLFPGWVAVCDACGASIGPEPREPEDHEAVLLLASVPGITEAKARELVARGFRDFSDVVKLALPERAVKRGLHHAIARRALLVDLESKAGGRPSGPRCPVCGAAWGPRDAACDRCGSARGPAAEPGAIDRKIEEVTGELVDLARDEDFREMPEEVRDEILQAFAGLSEDDILREEYRRQIAAWWAKGFDVTALEALLASDLQGFREKSVRLIRAQIRKKSDAGTYRCPLCDAVLEPAAEECENCGARFA